MVGMSQAPKYTRTTGFAADERGNVGGRSTVRTAQVDAELDAISDSINALQANQSLNQRDDGEIRDGRVKIPALASEVLALLISYGANPRGAWLTGTSYDLKDLVTQSSNTYMATTAHVGGTFATDLAAGKWILLAIGSTPTAASIPFTPTTNISASTIQLAIEESDAENRGMSEAAMVAAAALITDLANSASVSKGDALIAVKQPFTNAAAQTQHDKNRQSVAVDDFLGATDTLRIQNALDNAPDGSEIKFTPGATYNLVKNPSLVPSVYTHGDQPCLCVYNRKRLTLNGQGAKLKVSTHGLTPLDVLACSGVKVTGFIIEGPANFPPLDGTTGRAEKGVSTAGYYHAAATANGSPRNNSQDTSALTTGGYGGAFPRLGGGTGSTWGTWNGGFIGNDGDGIFFGLGSTDCSAEDNEVYGFNNSGIRIDAQITEFYGWASCARITLRDNYLHDNYTAGIEYHNPSAVFIDNNISDNNGHPNASLSHALIDPGYGIASNNGAAPMHVEVTNNIFRGNKRKGIDAHSLDTAIVTGNVCTDSGYGIMLVNGSAGVIRNLVVSNNIVARIAYPNSAQATGIYVERNATGAVGFSGNVVITGNLVYEIGVPPGSTALFPGTSPVGFGIILSGNLAGSTCTGNVAQNNTYFGLQGICRGYAGTDAVTGTLSGNDVRGKWATGINDSATGGAENLITGNNVILSALTPTYTATQTGILSAADRRYPANNISVPSGAAFMTGGAAQEIDLIIQVNCSSGGAVTYTTGFNQSKYVTAVSSFANGLQITLANGVVNQGVMVSQTSSAKAVKTAGGAVVDYIYTRNGGGNPLEIGFQVVGTDVPAAQITGSFTFRISI